MTPRQQLQQAAKAMIDAAEKGRSVARVLKAQCPHVHGQIVRDRNHPGLLSLWGRCVNVDENVGQTIVHPAILQAIGELAGVPMTGKVVHAGLQHTYGYLFSLIDTPYGAKRERWVTTDLESGFGIDLSLLGDQPRDGTLLANLTWFLGKIVYRDRPRSLGLLERNAAAVARELRDYDFARVVVHRVVERVALPGKPGREAMLIIDLVPYPHPPADLDAESTLLIYSVQGGPRSPLKLITAFPVRPAMEREIRESVAPDRQVEVRLRYNAYLPGLFGRTVLGRRDVS